MLRWVGVPVLSLLIVTLAMANASALGLGVTVLSGVLLIFGGLRCLTLAHKTRGSRAVLEIVIGIAYVGAGFYCLTHPLLPLTTAIFPYRKWTRS